MKYARQLIGATSERTVSKRCMLAEKLAQIERFLSQKQIFLEVTRQPLAVAADIAEAERDLGRPIPDDLKEIYTRFANGFEIFWKKEADFARFGLPDLRHFVERTLSFRAETREQYDEAEKKLERVEEARHILLRMLNWGVLWDTGGDGNLVCIDLCSGEVLFHEREWSCYPSYINGYLIAPSVNRLLDDWGSICFLDFSGGPGDCPPHGGSAVPDYDRQKYNLKIEPERSSDAPSRWK